jgi:hypothetical protein
VAEFTHLKLRRYLLSINLSLLRLAVHRVDPVDYNCCLFAWRRAMSIYKFKIGETVFLKPSRDQNLPRGAYTVVRKLPEHDGEFEYRVRSSLEEHERVVRESEMRAAP